MRKNAARSYTRTQHFPRNVVEASAFCKRCNRFTPHQVSGGVITHCLENHAQVPANTPPPAMPVRNTQAHLFTRRNV